MTKLWGNLTKEQLDEIREGAGEQTAKYGHYLSWRFPFIHRYKDILVFGGNCGCCGKWNWQWCSKGWEWTAPCKECCNNVREVNNERNN